MTLAVAHSKTLVAPSSGAADKVYGTDWNDPHALTGVADVTQGGTGADNAADARTNLGLGTLATQSGTFSGTSSGTNTGDQGGTAGRILIGNGAGSITDDAGLTYNSTTNTITLGGDLLLAQDRTNSKMFIGALPADPNNYSGMWFNTSSPDATNYAFLASTTETFLNAPSGGTFRLRIGNSNQVVWTSGNMDFTGKTVNNVGTLKLDYLTDYNNTVAYIFTSTDSTHAWSLNNRTASKVPWQIIGHASQTADLEEWKLSGGSVLCSISKDGYFKVAGNKVVGARDTGWTAMTGSADEGTAYDTASVTLAQLAGRVMALQAALTTHGLIGA